MFKNGRKFVSCVFKDGVNCRHSKKRRFLGLIKGKCESLESCEYRQTSNLPDMKLDIPMPSVKPPRDVSPNIRELTAAEEGFLATNHKCPICKTGKMLGGPEGGCAQNIMCADCRAEFWFAYPFRTQLMPRNPSRDANVYGLEPLQKGY